VWDSVALFALGAAVILYARTGLGEESQWEPAAMVTGGILIAVAHFRNEKLCAANRNCCVPSEKQTAL
jgi:hypothetical protein